MLIKNYRQIATTPGRKKVLHIINAGLEAILPKKVIEKNITLKNNILTIKDKQYNLKEYKGIYVIGFGKASCSSALAIYNILSERIYKGFVIDTSFEKIPRFKVIKGNHPIPSLVNIKAAKELVKLVSKLDSNDLVLCLISGGGSALLSNPLINLKGYQKLNKELLLSGASIQEVNTVRKHISNVKGGNLAKHIYPAKLVSIIFSDVVGDNLGIIASGPTVKDNTTKKDAEKVLKKYKIKRVKLFETTKENKYFSRVDNILLLTNKVALESMQTKAEALGLSCRIISNKIKGEAKLRGPALLQQSTKGINLAAGETTVKVKGKGKGGRNQEMALSVVDKIKNEIFVSIGSDGTDNSDVAGAIVDINTKIKAAKLNLNNKIFLENNDSYNYFRRVYDQIITGPTGTNVADLMIILKPS